MNIPFNKACIVGKELYYISQAVIAGEIKGGGPFSDKCCRWLERETSSYRALLTSSCTAALEMSALLCHIQPGDEVIMPSYTFTSTANAFVLRGARPVFVDIRPDTLNIDERLIERALSPKTKAICVVHYAGVACEMDAILALAEAHKLPVVEDAAQGVKAFYKDRALGSIGDFGCFSFHETKNFSSGEGGALLINAPSFAERAEYILEKGTNRSRFFRGEVNKYNWVDIGSSYLPSEIVAAFLWAQLEQAEVIQSKRMALWERYHFALEELERRESLRRPIIPSSCRHNAHMYYLLLPTTSIRNELMEYLKSKGILAPFHFLPLHASPFGQQYWSGEKSLPITEDLSSRLMRLPLFFDFSLAEQDHVIESICSYFSSRH